MSEAATSSSLGGGLGIGSGGGGGGGVGVTYSNSGTSADGSGGGGGARRQGRSALELRVGRVAPPSAVTRDFPTLQNTAGAAACTCAVRATDRALYELLTSASKQGRMAEASARFWEHWRTTVTKDQSQCCAYVMQLCREENMPEALQVLRLMVEHGVSRTVRFYDALIKHMRTHVLHPYSEELIWTLTTLPLACSHVRAAYGELFVSGVVGVVARDIKVEDRFIDGLYLFDLLLQQAADPSCGPQLARGDIWGIMLRAAMQRHQAVVSVALWKRARAFLVPSASMFDMALRTVCYTIENGDPSHQVAVAFAADEPLGAATMGELFDFAVQEFIDVPQRYGIVANATLVTLLLSCTLRFERADMAERLFMLTLNDRERYARDVHTIVQMFHVLTHLAKPELAAPAHQLLQQARAEGLLSPGAVASFMATQLIANNFAVSLALYNELKQTKEVPIETFICSQVLKAVRCDRNDWDEMKRLFAEMLALGVQPDVVMLNQMQKSALDCGRLAEAEQYQAMVPEGGDSDHVAIVTRVRLLCKRGEVDQALELVGKNELLRHVTMAPICDALAEHNRPDLLPTVMSMIQASKVELTAVMVCALIKMCRVQQKGTLAADLFDLYERACPEVRMDTRIALLMCLRDCGAELLPRMIIYLNRFVAQGLCDAACFSVTVSAAFRAGQRDAAWQLYGMMMQSTVPLDSVQLATLMTDVRTPDEMLRGLNDFAARGVQPNAVTWANVFKTIATQIRSPPLAMELFARMQAAFAAQPLDQVACNAVLNCLDRLADARVVIDAMARSGLRFDSFFYVAVMNVCLRARDAAAGEAYMLEYLRSDSGWFGGIWGKFETLVGRSRAAAFEQQHGDLLANKRSTPETARAIIPVHESKIDRRGERKRSQFLENRHSFLTHRVRTEQRGPLVSVRSADAPPMLVPHYGAADTSGQSASSATNINQMNQ